jgi:hypothetical protein
VDTPDDEKVFDFTFKGYDIFLALRPADGKKMCWVSIGAVINTIQELKDEPGNGGFMEGETDLTGMNPIWLSEPKIVIIFKTIPDPSGENWELARS